MNTKSTLSCLLGISACLFWQNGFAGVDGAAALGPPQLNDRVMPQDLEKLNRHKKPPRLVEKGFERVAVEGDTVSGIVSIYNKVLAPRDMRTSADLVRAANPGVSGERLAPGQKLFIPAVETKVSKK